MSKETDYMIRGFIIGAGLSFFLVLVIMSQIEWPTGWSGVELFAPPVCLIFWVVPACIGGTAGAVIAWWVTYGRDPK